MMLRHAREAKGLTQADLAQRAGLTQVHISNVETGKTMPSKKTQDKIARALNDPNIDWYKTKIQGMLPLHYFDESPEERVARAVYLYFKGGAKKGQSKDYRLYLEQVRFIEELLQVMPGLLNYSLDPEEANKKTEIFLKNISDVSK